MTAITPFRKSFPIDFRLYTIQQGAFVPVLFMASDDSEQDLYLEITNEDDQDLVIPQAKGTASATTFHFQLLFRPGILTPKFLKQSTLTVAGWQAAIGTLPSGSNCISLLNTSASVTLAQGKSLTVNLGPMSANTIGGARGTNVDLQFNLAADFTGRRMQHLAILGELGQKNIPLHVDIVGSPTVLNDGKTENALTVRMENISQNTLTFSTDPTQGVTKFTIEVWVQPTGQTMEWALVEASASAGLSLKWGAGDATLWTTGPPETIALGPRSILSWTITNKTVSGLTSGEGIEATLSGIVCGLPAGQTFMTFKYFNVPGYWDGQFTIQLQKGPVATRGANVGIGTSSPSSPLEIYGQIQANQFKVIDAQGNWYKDNWIGMANNIGDQGEYLSVNGITGADGIRRVALYGTHNYIQGNAGINQVPDADSSLSIPYPQGANRNAVVIGEVAKSGKPKAALAICSNEPGDAAIPIAVFKGTNPLFQVDLDGQVGIGTAPSALLHLSGSDPTIFLAPDPWSSTKDEAVIRFGDTNHLIKVVWGTGMVFHDVNGMSFTGSDVSIPNNKLGVGTGSPKTNLDVNGTIFTGTTTPINGQNQDVRLLINNLDNQATQPNQNLGVIGWIGANRDMGQDLSASIHAGSDTWDDQGYLAFSTSNGNTMPQERLRIDKNGNVGIGTTNPQFPLHVEGGAPFKMSDYEYLNQQGTGHNDNQVNGPYGIRSEDAILAIEFDAFSDRRIKEVKGVSDGAQDLRTLMRIEIIDYTFKDRLAKGNRPQKKVIGQQLAEAYPQSVNTQNTEVVPDIMQKATLEAGTVHLAGHGLQAGERVQLYFEDDTKEVLEVTQPTSATFQVATEKRGAVFVYGREVDDFHTVDIEALTTLNISATQELTRKVQRQEAEMTALQAKNENLTRQLEELQGVVQQLMSKVG